VARARVEIVRKAAHRDVAVRDDRGPRRDDRGPRREDRAPAPAPVKPLVVKVEFLPEPGMLAAIAKEMRSSHCAYPVFTAAKMILNKTQFHRVRVTSEDPEVPLYQLGEGAITSDRSLLERDAFRQLKDKYYREEVLQNDPPKGNFANVARLRGGGLFLGPTNHHSYQPRSGASSRSATAGACRSANFSNARSKS